MSARRQLTASVLACVVGALLALFAASRTWVVQLRIQSPPLPPVQIARAGAVELPWLSALALAALAGAAALLATRGAVRAFVGFLVLLAGLGVLAAGGYGLLGIADVRVAWPLLCLPAGVLVAAGGSLAALRGRGWPAMGARYDRPRPSSREWQQDRVERAGPSPSDVAMWDALDRGEDPSR